MKFSASTSDPDGTTEDVGTVNSTGGAALLQLTYPADGNAYAFNATILNCTDGYRTVQNVISSPLQVTVGLQDSLNSIVINDTTVPSRHTIQYWFSDPDEYMLDMTGRQVTVKINNTQPKNYPVDYPGVAEFTKDLPAINATAANATATTYIITATFSGDNPTTATANSTAPDGTGYAACTTLQYNVNATTLGYQPSSNTIILTVNPQSTLATNQTKTPEQMQQDAQNSGWMPPPKSEYGIFYPWFRLHYQFTPDGIFVFDVGISPLPFANTVRYTSALTYTVTSLLRTALPNIAIAIALSESLSQIAAQFGPEGFFAALLISTETIAISLSANWNSVEGLVSVFLGTLFSTVITYLETLILDGIEIFTEIVDIVNKISNLWDIGFGTLYNMINVPINIAFMILTLLRAITLGANFTWQ